VVAVVILGSGSHLGPLPTHEGDEVGVLGIARYGVALADRLHRVLPVLWSVGFRVIGNPVEVQLGDIACIVTGVGRGIRPTRPLHQRQAKPERIHRVGRMHMHVTKQDLLRLFDPQVGLGLTLPLGPRIYLRLRGPGLADLTRVEGVPFPIALRIWDISWSRLIDGSFFRRSDYPGGQHHQQTGADSGYRRRKVSLPHDCSLLFGYIATPVTAYYSIRTLSSHSAESLW
jgi:hypothetical protein